MYFLKLLPKRFSTRLILMTLLSGLIPIIIFSVLMQTAATRFPYETSQAIDRGEKEEWRKSEVFLRTMAEDFIRQKALDTALHMELFLRSHPQMTLSELQNEPEFKKLAVQPVGTGYTAVFNSDTAINCFHAVPSIQGMDISKTAEKWPDHWEIIKGALGGKHSKGYYKWPEPDGEMRDKYMYISPLNKRTGDGVPFAVAATTYVDEFFQPLLAAQEVSRDTATQLMRTVERMIRISRNWGFLFMALGIILIAGFSYWVGTYFSKAINHLRDATKKVNRGDFDICVESMSGDVGELIEDFNIMVSRLAETTVKKEELEKSEERLKEANASLKAEISERERAQKALLESEERFRSVVENSHEGIAVMDDAYKVIYANPGLSRIINMAPEEVEGHDLRDFLSDESKDVLKDVLSGWQNGSRPEIKELKLIGKGGEECDVELRGSMVKDSKGNKITIMQVLDITGRKKAREERDKLERKLQQARRMEAIGTLAGGVAHDLNNILSGLVSYPDLLLLDLQENSPMRESILTIKKSGEKASAVVQDLLTLARRGVNVLEPVSLNQIAVEYFNSPEYEELKKYNPCFRLETSFEEDLFKINGSPVHLSKTLMNLVSNAVEAMPDGGELKVSTKNAHIQGPKGENGLSEGDYVIIKVSDTGVGISQGEMEKIFEPFYTKKVMGRNGTGLGMAVVWGTVKDHNGYIDVKSDVNKGTTFTIFFPARHKKIESDESQSGIEEYMGKGESVLVIDDVKEQRVIASGMLKRLGYSVTAVSSGEEAVDYLKNESVDLIILDMIMDPGMDGLDTYRKILEYHPGQKAIIASGYSQTDRVKETLKLGAGVYIKKPYLLEKIGIAVRRELDR